MQLENRRCFPGAGLPIKDRVPIDPHRAIRSRVFHVKFLSLDLGPQMK